MIRETDFRKQALAKWQQENEQITEELCKWAFDRSNILTRLKQKLASSFSLASLFRKTDP